MGGTTNSYYLGIDLGTTYTAAAVHRNGHTQMATLGNRAAAAPSVLLLRDDGQFLYGEAAEQRGESEPHRLAREFKRRLGDPVPLIVDRTPFAADALMAKMLRWVVDTVTRTEGEPPAGVAVTHPANWGDYKRDLLRQSLRVLQLDDAVMLSEPEAAAIHYASQERLADGATVAVYDLGGGTFDAAILKRTGAAWELLGNPEGVERLGGIDVDAAVFTHVARTLGITTDAGDTNDDNGHRTAVHRLRRDCVTAKEILSEDTHTSISVLLPDLQTQVRLTRAELETMIRPTLTETITALSTALRSAQITATDIDAVLLVGGSSRIPLVAQLISTELARPVVLDAHPKHSIALGAAVTAAAAAGSTGPDGSPPPVPPATPPESEPNQPPVPVAASGPAPGHPAPAVGPAPVPAVSQPGQAGKVMAAVGLAVVVATLAAIALVGNPFADDGDEGGTGTAATTPVTATSAPPPTGQQNPATTSPPTTDTRPTTPPTTAFTASEPPLSLVPTPPSDLGPTETRQEIAEPGAGLSPLGPGDEVTFQFVGRLADGTVFVNSWETSGEVTVTLGEGTLVDGFEEALYGLVAGDRAELYVGREAGYGSEGNSDGSVPPDSDLAYLVDITAVNGQSP